LLVALSSFYELYNRSQFGPAKNKLVVLTQL